MGSLTSFLRHDSYFSLYATCVMGLNITPSSLKGIPINKYSAQNFMYMLVWNLIHPVSFTSTRKDMVIEIRSATLLLRFIELVQRHAGIFLRCWWRLLIGWSCVTLDVRVNVPSVLMNFVTENPIVRFWELRPYSCAASVYLIVQNSITFFIVFVTRNNDNYYCYYKYNSTVCYLKCRFETRDMRT
jgi:hypothetical protein